MALRDLGWRTGTAIRDTAALGRDAVLRVPGVLRDAQQGVADLDRGLAEGLGWRTPPAATAPVAPVGAPPAAPVAVPAPAAPTPVWRTPTRDAELDRAEAEYNEAPEAFEAERMAEAPTSGELRYKMAGRPWRSHNVGADRTDVAGDADLATTRGDERVFGQWRKPQTEAGGFSASGDDEQYQRMKRNTMGDAEYEAERAGISRNRVLADDPFAPENAAVDRQVRLAGAQADAYGQREEAKQRARYTEIDRVLDDETRQDLADIDSVADGTPVKPGGPPMTPAMREQLKQHAIDLNRQQKREIRARAFRAPAVTEADAAV